MTASQATKVSIITPSLNQGRFIERCIQSVLDQAYENFEHIVIDGGSDDETVAVLERYAHIRWISEPDSGQTQAINKGLALARGDFVAWLNCDDEYLPGAFHSLDELSRSLGDPVVVLGAVEMFFGDRFLRVMQNRVRSLRRFLNPWIPHTNISQPGVFISTGAFKKVQQLNEDLHYTMDYDLLCRLMKARVPFARLAQAVARYHIHPDCKTGKGWSAMYPEQDRLVKLHSKDLGVLDRLLFRLSYHLLRPVMRFIYKIFLPPVF